MARSNYSAGKRQRERDKAKKKKDKTDRQREHRSTGGGGDIPVTTADEIQGGTMMSVEEVMNSVIGGSEGKERATIPSRLFVGGLNWRVTTDQLRKKFEEHGKVSDAVIVTDRDTGDSRGFGFVTMADRKDGSEVIRQLNGADFEGRTLVVRQATERNR